MGNRSSLVRWMICYAGTLRLLLLGNVLVLSVYFAFVTLFNGSIPQNWLPYLPFIAMIWALSQCTILVAFGIHKSLWSFTSIDEMLHLVGIGLIASIFSSVVIAGVLSRPVPLSIYLLCAIYSICGIAGARLGFRWIASRLRQTQFSSEQKTALIYGADAAGVGILSDLKRDCPEFRVIGFVDDRPECQCNSVAGLRVLGQSDELEMLAGKYGVSMIFTSSMANSEVLRLAMAETSLKNKLDIRVVTSFANEVRHGARCIPREVPVEQLLGRSPVEMNLSLIQGKVSGRIVMVTGAAGSIGSELCRQLAVFRPSTIVAYEINETALFFIEREMQEKFKDVQFVPCIGSVQNAQRLSEVLKTYAPSVVYHAAAYKHVPLMERHLFEVIENNVFGTDILLQCCREYGVKTFAMISSDKAVRPTSIMGVSKRIAELIVRSSSARSTNCVSVRFGNVLGSNGSVIPIFRKQIEMGGPVTVTHPEMVRYFMTITEASQLVLQASSLGSSDEIFVLDMGLPIKIVDLAERLIRLMGYIPGKDIEIKFSGMRPGEKLFEELSTTGQDTRPTLHEKIAVLNEPGPPPHYLREQLHHLQAACQNRDAHRTLTILQRLVPEYTPSRELLMTVRESKNQVNRSEISRPEINHSETSRPEWIAS